MPADSQITGAAVDALSAPIAAPFLTAAQVLATIAVGATVVLFTALVGAWMHSIHKAADRATAAADKAAAAATSAAATLAGLAEKLGALSERSEAHAEKLSDLALDVRSIRNSTTDAHRDGQEVVKLVARHADILSTLRCQNHDAIDG